MRLAMVDAEMRKCPGQGEFAGAGCIGDGHGWFTFTVFLVDGGFAEYTCQHCGSVFERDSEGNERS